MTKKICRSFRQDFPQFVERAEALGVSISLGEGRRNGRERVFWLDGYRQLTGYTTNSDGSPFTLDDAARNIDKILTGIEEDRAAAAELSIPDRFARVMAEFRKMVPQHRMIGEVRQPNGDRGYCFFMSNYEGGVTLDNVAVAEAKAKWRRDETDKEHMARFCDMLEADFARRQEEATA
jgi:plasmid stabilization system protein ParE